MICKKCGTNIPDTAKFCNVCGEKIEVENNINITNSAVEEKNTEMVTLQSEPIQQVESEKVQENVISQPTVNPNTEIEQTVVVPPIQPNSEPKKKKNNTWIFIVGGVILGIFAIVLVIFAINKSSNNSIKVLEKALSNLEEKGEDNGTINASILMESNTSDTYNLSATIKYAENMDSYDMELILNKSILYDEMKFYLTYNDDKAVLYAKSSLIDMLGVTSSQSDMWLHYLVPIDDIEIEEETDQKDVEYDLSSILDNKHYKFINEENNLRQYQLIIDNELVNKIKSKLDQEEIKEFENSISSLTTDGSKELTETYYINFYINKLNELEKISMDLTDKLNDESITKAIISFEFVNFGNTSVELPSDVKDSTMDLETYMSTYSSYGTMNDNSTYIDSGM